MRDLIGRTLGHYRIVEKIGEGGMGVVYRAHDERLDRDVAIKVLHEAVVQDADRLARFEREAKAVAKLDHPNILAIHDFGTDEGVTYAVTELLDGQNLRQSIPASGLPWQKVVEIGAAIADGLAAAHGKGIVHRDLKPENVFVTSDGRVKVLDFGLAQMKEPVEEEAETATLTPAGTVAGSVMGTMGYMSPEQLRGESSDARSDIFALGCVLYEMLSGQSAFLRNSTAETTAAILKEEPERLSSTGTILPADVERSIHRCLEKSPDARYQSSADLAFALRSISTDQVISPVTAPEEKPPGERRRMIWVAAAAAIAFAVIASLWIVRLWSDRPVSAKKGISSLAVLPFTNLSGDPEQDYIADGLTYGLIAELGRVTALKKVTAPSSVMQFREERPPLPEIARVLGVEGVVGAAVFSSEGRVRITAQLFHGVTETPIWSNSYEADAADVFTLLGDLTRAISQEIEVALSAGEEARLTRARPVDPEALKAYLRGRQLGDRRTAEDNRKALELFQAASYIEPTFALAHVGMADAYAELGQGFSAGLSPREGFPRAKAAVTRALELDRTLPEAHASLGFIATFYDWDWAAAEREFRRAIELNPSYARAHLFYSYYLVSQGRFEEAIAEINRAHELDPLSLQIDLNRTTPLYFSRRHDESIEISRRVLDLYPNSALGHYFLGVDYLEAGMHQEAIEELEVAASLSQEFIGHLGHAYARTGQREKALEILEQLEEHSEQMYVSPDMIAWIFVGLGDNDQAFAWLDKACDERAGQMPYLMFEPTMDPLRSDPRFDDLLARVGLTPQ